MQVAPEQMPESEVQQTNPPVAWSAGSEEKTEKRSSQKSVFTLSDLSAEDAKDDELVSKLKSLDINKDGRFSSEEIIHAAKEIVNMRHQKDDAVKNQRRMAWITLLIGFLLLLSIITNAIGAFWAVWLNKDTKASGESGIMMTDVSGRQPPKPVASGSIRIATQGLSGLKEASKEELEALEELRFFHDGGFHRMKVSQLHRYDGRTEVWGWPAGAVVVEDTGEVHYSPYVVPSSTWDDCWGPNGTLTDVCGVAVDNEPPTSLEVEEEVKQDAADGPSNDSVPSPGGRRLVEVGSDSSGKPVFEEAALEDPDAVAAARRLSGRRRSGGGFSFSSPRRRSGSSYSSPRRRSGGYSSARRRSFGGTASSSTSYGSSSWRRRGTVAASGYSGSRRRSPSYYGSGGSRRRGGSINIVAVNTGGGYYYEGQYRQHGDPCGPGRYVECSDERCWCEERATDWTVIIIIIVVLLTLCCCCAVCYCFAAAGKSNEDQHWLRSSTSISFG